MTIGGILEWILGNTFPAVVFSVFGTFWLAYGGLLNPSFAAFSSYAPPDANSAAEGLQTTGFNASIAYWFLFMGVICFVFLICSLRTNIVFFTIFLSLAIAFGLLTGAFLLNADDISGNASKAHKLIVVSAELSLLPEPMTKSIQSGCRCMHICYFHVRVVHFLGSFACVSRLSHSDPGR